MMTEKEIKKKKFNNKKTGLIMEGGAMRGLFTCGVIDVMMEQGIEYDGAIGVSAGAAFGCNYKSRQINRPHRYNVKYCTNKEYCSFRSWIRTGDLYGADFCYRRIPYELDPWDFDTFDSNPMEFYVVCTDAETGKPVYQKLVDSRAQMDWVRASASMPVVSAPVCIDGYKLLDGGISDPIPVRHFEKIGYTKNVVILTQPREYRKKKMKGLPLIKLFLHRYPALGRVLTHRHERYNQCLKMIEQKEKAGTLFVIRPPEPLGVGSMEKHPEELERVYRIGRETMEKQLGDLLEFLGRQRS